jgi:RHS repeat-associated protein
MEFTGPRNRRLVKVFYLLLTLCLLSGPITTNPLTSAQSSEQSGPGSVVDYGAQPDIGDPVSASTGAYHFTLPLLNLGGPMDLHFSLSYRSDFHQMGPSKPPDFPFRFWWSPKVRAILYPADWMGGDEDVWTILMANGNIVSFKESGGEWVLPDPSDFWYENNGSAVRYKLEETADYIYLMDPIAERVCIFEKLTIGSSPNEVDIGRIVRVLDRNDNQLIYTYGADDQNNPVRIEDGLGRSLDMTYGESLTQVTDQAGRQVTFSFDNGADNGGVWTLRSVTDPLGHAIAFAYATIQDPLNPGRTHFHNIINVTHPLGNVLYSQDYDVSELDGVFAPRVVEQTDAYENTTALTYTPDQSQVTEEQADGNVRVYRHHGPNSLLQSVTDAAGNTLTFGKNDNEQRTSVTDRLGGVTTFDYHAETGHIASVTNALGKTFTYTYEAQQQTFTNPINAETTLFTFYNLTRIDYPDGTDETFTYDAKGNTLSHKDRSDQTWTYTYNDRGQILTTVNPLGGTVTRTYNADGTLSSSTDADTGTITYDYDLYKRRIRLTHPDGSFTQTTYDMNDRITSITNENGQTYEYTYDANGNLIQRMDPAGHVTQYAYDLMDRVTRITDKLGRQTHVIYDTMGRMASVTDPNGEQFDFGYDPRGWRDRITRGGETWELEYTDEGQVSSFTTPLGHQVTYQSNALGYETAVIDPMGRSATLVRDDVSRVSSVTDLLERTTTYSYNGVGQLTEISKPEAGAAHYARNGLGLVEQLTDQNDQAWTFGYSVMGRLQTVTDPLSNTWQHDYDDRGRLKQTTYPDGRTVVRTYDAHGNVTRRVYSDGTDLHFEHDERSHLVATNALTLTREAEGRVIRTEDAGVASGAAYDDGGRLEAAVYQNGTFTVTYTYDAVTGLLSRVSDDLTGAWVSFSYDRDRKLVGLQRSNGVTTTYQRDDVGRITRMQDGTFIDLQYTLDAAGQVMQVDSVAPLIPSDLLAGGSDTLSYDASSQISSTGFGYDQRGRLIASPDHTFRWDDANRLTGIDDGAVTLTYNGLNDLTTRTENGSTTHYCYNYAIDLQPIVAERDDGSGQLLRTYVWTPEGELLYMIDAADGNAVTFYHFDRTGSTLALTDSTGSVTDAYAYAPYGNLLGHTGSSPQPFTFNGRWGVRQEGGEGDLYQMRARYYDAKTGRFMSRDPVWPVLGSASQVIPYQFAKKNPLQWNDVTGLLDLIIPDGNGGGTGAISGNQYDDYLAGLSTEMAYANSVEQGSQEAQLLDTWMTLSQFSNFTVIQDSAIQFATGELTDSQSIFSTTEVENHTLVEDFIVGWDLEPDETVTDDQLENLIENWSSLPDFWDTYYSPDDDQNPSGNNEGSSKY